MSEKKTKMIERLYQYFEKKNIAPTAIEKAIGISNGYFSTQLKRKANMGEAQINKIIDYCRDINPEWLITGNGNMLRDDLIFVNENTPGNRIPLVSISAVAGFGNADSLIRDQDVKDYYVIPKFKNYTVDFMIEISGSSMYPKYNSGDVVGCKILREKRFIQWNRCHIIATREQGILVKRILPCKNTKELKIVSDNPDYPPFKLCIEDVISLALVIGVIRLE